MCDNHNMCNEEVLQKMVEELAALVRSNTIRFNSNLSGKRPIVVSVTKMQNACYVQAVDEETHEVWYAATITPEQADDIMAWMKEYEKEMEEKHD